MRGKIPTNGWRRRGSSTLEYVLVIAAAVLFASLLYAAVSSDDIAGLLREKVIQALNGELMGDRKEIVKGDPGNGGLPEGGSLQPGNSSGGAPEGYPGVPNVSGGGSDGIQGETSPDKSSASQKPPSNPEAPSSTPKGEGNAFLGGFKTVGNVALDFIGYHDAKAALTGVDENGNKIGWGERILRGAMVLPIAKPVKGAKMAIKYGDDVLRFAKGKVDDLASRLKKKACACPKKVGKKTVLKQAQLPTKGKVRYVPPENWTPRQPLPKKRGGYVDKFGNIWTKGPSRTKGQPFEWDVQLSRTGKQQLGRFSRDGSHLNVSLDGRITHK